jgi:hypothetical protein
MTRETRQWAPCAHATRVQYRELTLSTEMQPCTQKVKMPRLAKFEGSAFRTSGARVKCLQCSPARAGSCLHALDRRREKVRISTREIRRSPARVLKVLQ